MDFLTYSHNHNLVILSLILAVVSGFTGFTLTQNLSAKTLLQRKISVSMAAVALGGGIWSMHFVAMLGLNLSVMVFYDAAITLASALIAILIVAVALMNFAFFCEDFINDSFSRLYSRCRYTSDALHRYGRITAMQTDLYGARIGFVFGCRFFFLYSCFLGRL